MEDMKLGNRRLSKDMRHYEKMQYHAASQQEQDAVNTAITAVTGLMYAKKPNKKLNEQVNVANLQLMRASTNRRKREKTGAKMFATKGFEPVEDVHDAQNLGPFTGAYLENLKMKRLEQDAKSLGSSMKKLAATPDNIRRDLEPNAAKRRKEKDSDNRYGAYDRGNDIKPGEAKAFVDEGKKLKLKMNLVGMLHEAASAYQVAKISDPKLTYQSMVEGTALEGISNFEAMTPGQKNAYATQIATSGAAMAGKEAKLASQVEEYHRKYAEDSSNVPYKEWVKSWTMDRQANMQVQPKEETAIRAMVAKMKAARAQVDIGTDMAQFKTARNNREQLYDNEVAQQVAESPTKATIQKMTAQNILGAKQLAKDTAYANAKLANETANPHRYGANKELNPGGKPNYRATDHQGKAMSAHKQLLKMQKRLLKDANNLATTGSKSDQAILDADEKAAEANRPTMTKGDRHEVKKEVAHWDKMRKRVGRAGVKAEKEGVAVRMKKHAKAWKEARQALGAPDGPSYGASALEGLPTRSKSPMLEQPSKYNLNGVSMRAVIPVRANSPPNSGLSKMPKISPEMKRMAVDDADKEPKPQAGMYKKEDKAIVDGKSEDQVAKAEVAKEMAKAKKEAAGLEGQGIGAKLAGASATEKEIESARDDGKIQKSVSKVEMPEAKAEKDDKGMPWDTAGASKMINDAEKGKSYAKAPQPSQNTASGAPLEA